MRVNLVNPSNPLLAASNPRRRAASGTTVLVVKSPQRRRRANAPLAMAAANPLVLPNRRRRRRHAAANPKRRKGSRRRRANPYANPRTLGDFAMTAAIGALAGGASFYLNKWVIADLGTTGAAGAKTDTENGMWIRGFARLALGGLASWFFPNRIGAAVNGAMSYPLWRELDDYMSRPAGQLAAGRPAPTAAALTDAALSDVLDDLYS